MSNAMELAYFVSHLASLGGNADAPVVLCASDWGWLAKPRVASARQAREYCKTRLYLAVASGPKLGSKVLPAA